MNLTPQQADAATLRAIGERMQQRGEAGSAALTFQMARWCEDGVELPLDVIEHGLAALKDLDGNDEEER